MPATPDPLTAAHYLDRLHAMQSDEELRKIQRYFKSGKGDYGEGDRFIGVRMGHVFDLAKEFIDLPPREIEALLESDIHEARAGAVSVMNKQASHRRTSNERRRELFDLYLRRHDRINNWDLVDLGAQHVVGRYLADKPRDVLFKLAASPNMWERRTALYATFHFVRNGDTQDALAIAERLVEDSEDLIQKAVGAVLRSVGGEELIAFLDRHAARMPRTMLTTAMEHLNAEQKAHYRSL
ncbi:MAG: DNA alkylation repair protein [Chloroflexota bacterium]